MGRNLAPDYLQGRNQVQVIVVVVVDKQHLNLFEVEISLFVKLHKDYINTICSSSMPIIYIYKKRESTETRLLSFFTFVNQNGTATAADEAQISQ